MVRQLSAALTVRRPESGGRCQRGRWPCPQPDIRRPSARPQCRAGPGRSDSIGITFHAEHRRMSQVLEGAGGPTTELDEDDSRRPRLALIHYSASPVVGGVERVMTAQATMLRGAGYDVRIIAGRGDSDLIPEADSWHPEVERLTCAIADSV